MKNVICAALSQLYNVGIMLNRTIIGLCFFFSGFASLVFEIIFSRQLTRILGSGMSANACVFAAFLAGCALGAYLSMKEKKILQWIDNFPSTTPVNSKEPLNNFRTYGRLELLCACSSILLYLVLGSPASNLIATAAGQIAYLLPNLTDIFRFAVCYFLLLLPCACMGATYGVIANAFRENIASESETKTDKQLFPLLYGINTIGAGTGTFVAGFLLLPYLGLNLSCLLGALVYLLIFILCETRRSGARTISTSTGGIYAATPESPNKLWLAIAFISGFLSLFLEITWTRIFSLVLGGSVFSLSIVLIVILIALGLASMAVSLISPEKRVLQLLIAACLLDASICLLLDTSMCNYLIWSFFSLSSHVTPRIVADHFWQAIVTRALIAFIFIFPAAFFLGAILPLSSKLSSSGKDDGLFYSANCIGAVLAGLTFVAIFFPAISSLNNSLMMSALIFTAVLSALAAATIFLRIAINSTLRPRIVFGAACFSCIMIPCSLLVLRPEWHSAVMSSGSLVYERATAPSDNATNSLFYKEGLNSTVSVHLNQSANTISFANDGKTEATLPIDATLISPGTDHSTHNLLSVLPVLFHPGKAREALLIGAGSGMSAAAFLSYPDLTKLSVAELEPTVIEACQKFSQYNGGAFDKKLISSGRIEIKPFDARFILSTSKQQYDVISSQPADPWVAGAADLFTVEFWKLAFSRLRNDGVFCQWVQLYAIPHQDLLSLIKSFTSVFPNTRLFHPPGAGELLLLGFKTEGPEDVDLISQLELKLHSNHSWFEASSGIANAYDCLALSVASPRQLKELVNRSDIRLNTDDLNIAEYSTARKMLTSSHEVEQNLSSLLFALSASNKDSRKLAPEASSNLARAYARQYIQDSTVLKTLNQNRALSTSDSARKASQKPSVIWQDLLIRRAFKQNSSMEELMPSKTSIPELSSEDYFALFDQAFERTDLAKCAQVLNNSPKEVRDMFEWRLRDAFLSLRQGKSEQSERIFLNLLLERPNSIPALLGATYASLKANNAVNATMCLTRYLSINPWDAESQKLLALLLGDDELAKQHASNSSILRPGDISAFLPLLARCSNSSPEMFANILQKASKMAPNSTELTLVDRITKNGKNPELLLKNADFSKLVNEIQSTAEDANSGYKILGEP